MAQRKSWSQMTPRSRAGVVALSLVELLLTVVALRDLSTRDRAAVRGPKWIWSLVCLVQPVGPIAYLAFGRRGGSASTAELLAAD